MLPLAELAQNTNPSYRRYLWRKTGFLLQNPNQEKLYYFWDYLSQRMHLELARKPDESLKSALKELLLHFGYIPPVFINDKLRLLEEKYSWIFRHPEGGIILPLELLKSLMRLKVRWLDNFLFSLLLRLGLREQRNMLAYVGIDFETQFVMNLESNKLDLSLMLYLFFADLHLSGKAFLPKGKKILIGPWSTTASQQELVPVEILPHKPIGLMDYLNSYFPNQKKDIADLAHLLEHHPSSFYRPLSLLTNNAKNSFSPLFRQGYLVPVLPPLKKRKGPWAKDIAVISPQEILFHTAMRAKSL
ncbi:MAG: hypothetical protein NZM25_11430 [Leptospiraceae bacterium]|nr:hypothetical protein [Leptospiraceae bacterium]MDW8307451.1 hypothetical protein [Leptospiraceae bacterium]